jgi:hypothetical protein
MRHKIGMPGPGDRTLFLIVRRTGIVILEKNADGRARRGLIKKTTTEDRQIIFFPWSGPLLNPALPAFQVGQKIFQRQRQTRRDAVDIDTHALPVGFTKYGNAEQSAKGVHIPKDF